MRLLTIFLAFFSLTACSTVPESWTFDIKFWTSDEVPAVAEPTTDASPSKEKVVAPEPATTNDTVLELNADQLARVEVGQTKDEVLAILGPAANVDNGTTLADNYIKGGEVYDVLYFRAQVDGVEQLRALLFKANLLVGIGWSEVD
ncbi:MAG: hypothetical protein VX064_02325 [Pseudomonadota bacterium]|nr:hypothetical protein [Pseudomonadota bacterium]